MLSYSRLGYCGQLGNQMFQYAMLKGVAARTGFEPRIPKRFAGFGKHRGLVELGPFRIDCAELEAADLARLERRYVVPYDAGFDPGVFEVPDGTDFEGYYESYRYFDHIAADLRREFELREPFATEAREIAAEIRRRAAGRPGLAGVLRRHSLVSRSVRRRRVPLSRRPVALGRDGRRLAVRPSYLLGEHLQLVGGVAQHEAGRDRGGAGALGGHGPRLARQSIRNAPTGVGPTSRYVTARAD